MTEQRNDVAREREIAFLVDELGVERAYAERLVDQDADLWLVPPSERFVFESEEDVAQWEAARQWADALCRGFADPGGTVINGAACQLLWDLRERAEEALRRARQRAANA